MFKYPDTSLDYGSLFSQAFVCFGSGSVQAAPLRCQKLPVKLESKRAKATNLTAANVQLIKGACGRKSTDLEKQQSVCMSEAFRLPPFSVALLKSGAAPLPTLESTLCSVDPAWCDHIAEVSSSSFSHRECTCCMCVSLCLLPQLFVKASQAGMRRLK